MQFSRIAQDAPFGIMGIGNNITATVESFGHLQRSTGSAGGALKAMASSLMGGGGILLAVSLVTTALTVMSQKGITVSDVFNKLTGNFDEFKKSMSEANAEAAKTSGSEIGSVKALVSTASDLSVSMRDRLIAVKELQSQYPAYFGNLSKEQILNGDVATSVKAVTDALIAKAKASVFAGKIGELAAKEVPLREQETKLIEQGNKAIAKRDDLLKQIGQRPADEGLANRWVAAGRAVESIKDDLADVQKEIRGVKSETDKWQEALNKTTKISIATEFDPEKVKKIKQTFDTPIVQKVEFLPTKGMIEPAKFDIKAAFDMPVFHTKTGILSSLTQDMEKSRVEFINRLKSGYNTISLEAASLNEKLKSVIDSGLGQAFAGVGESIGSALATGGSVISAVGKSLLSSLGSILVELGKMAIAVGIGILGIRTALQTLNPAVAIAAGVALIAIGGIVSSKASSLGNSMGGKGGAGNISAGNSVQSPTNSVSTISSSGLQNVVFEISGNSLIGVIRNSMSKNAKLGGAITI